ncbi:MAG: AAA family ATPase [Dehalococcoidia bacterium]|nr:AAA family ATPase [Dehalococcoidia bacterium]
MARPPSVARGGDFVNLSWLDLGIRITAENIKGSVATLQVFQQGTDGPLHTGRVDLLDSGKVFAFQRTLEGRTDSLPWPDILSQLAEKMLARGRRTDDKGVSLVCMADVEAETVSWLWHPYIPIGKLTLLEGDPGIGKSWVSLAITTAVSLGKGLPGTEAIESAKVVLASAEDGLSDTIRPRLDAMGAEASKIHSIKGTLDFDNGGLAIMEGYIETVRPSLVIVDPLVAYIGAGVDIHRANETRAVMARLADLAQRYSVAILAVRHLTKGGTLKPIYRGLGSIDLAAACRSVLMAGCDPDNSQKRGIVQIKSNLAPTGPAIGYKLTDGGFYWTGESDLTWQKILSAEDTDNKSSLDEAVDFLRDELADGPIEAKQVFSDAKSLGIYERTLNRAKSKLRITSKREGESGKRGIARVKWQLPEDLEGQKDLDCQDCHIENFGNVNQNSYENASQGNGVGNVNPNPQREAVLGMPVEKVIELWRKQGAPVIHLGTGENCLDLEKLLSNPNVKPEHLQAVWSWLNKHGVNG